MYVLLYNLLELLLVVKETSSLEEVLICNQITDLNKLCICSILKDYVLSELRSLIALSTRKQNFYAVNNTYVCE